MQKVKNLNKGRLVFTLLLSILALAFVLGSLSYGPNARMIPLGVGGAALIMGVILIVNEVYRIRLLSNLDDGVIRFREGVHRITGSENNNAKQFVVVVGWILAFFVLVFFVGFHMGIVVSTFIYLKVRGGIPWFKALLMAGILWALIYVVFDLAMELVLFKGFLFGELVPSI